jgi:hypothetical protein
VGDLWLYWSATFIGTSIVALLLQKKFHEQKLNTMEQNPNT